MAETPRIKAQRLWGWGVFLVLERSPSSDGRFQYKLFVNGDANKGGFLYQLDLAKARGFELRPGLIPINITHIMNAADQIPPDCEASDDPTKPWILTLCVGKIRQGFPHHGLRDRLQRAMTGAELFQHPYTSMLPDDSVEREDQMTCDWVHEDLKMMRDAMLIDLYAPIAKMIAKAAVLATALGGLSGPFPPRVANDGQWIKCVRLERYDWSEKSEVTVQPELNEPPGFDLIPLDVAPSSYGEKGIEKKSDLIWSRHRYRYVEQSTADSYSKPSGSYPDATYSASSARRYPSDEAKPSRTTYASPFMSADYYSPLDLGYDEPRPQRRRGRSPTRKRSAGNLKEMHTPFKPYYQASVSPSRDRKRSVSRQKEGPPKATRRSEIYHEKEDEFQHSKSVPSYQSPSYDKDYGRHQRPMRLPDDARPREVSTTARREVRDDSASNRKQKPMSSSGYASESREYRRGHSQSGRSRNDGPPYGAHPNSRKQEVYEPRNGEGLPRRSKSTSTQARVTRPEEQTTNIQYSGGSRYPPSASRSHHVNQAYTSSRAPESGNHRSATQSEHRGSRYDAVDREPTRRQAVGRSTTSRESPPFIITSRNNSQKKGSKSRTRSGKGR